jgi:hypothetical protein
MTEEDYLHELIRQYKKAYGIDRVDINDEKFQKKFADYISLMHSHKTEYIRLLHTLGVYTDDEKTVEVGKGPFDSVAIDTKSTIITPYQGMFEKRNGKTYEGSHIIHLGDIYMISNNDGKITYEELDIDYGRVYMTHNMYHKAATGSWYELVRDNDVVIGVYGKETDKDMDSKIRKVIERFEEIGESYSNYGTSEGYYYYAQKSKHSVLKKEKVKYRELEYGRVR